MTGSIGLKEASYRAFTIETPVATPPSIVFLFVRMGVETDYTFIMRVFYVYIHTNKPYGRLYTGMTNHLATRSRQHKSKQIKGWSRKKKIELIEAMNPTWKDLYPEVLKISRLTSF